MVMGTRVAHVGWKLEYDLYDLFHPLMIQFNTIPKDFKTIEFGDTEACMSCELSWYKGGHGS
jgi:hypothetical protein